MRDIHYIVLHCSATREDSSFSVEQLRACHRARGFKTIGYHYYVMRNGDIAQTRHLDEIGAHVLGHNNDSIGICYEGGLDAQGRPKDTRTPAQREVLKRLLLELNQRFPEAIILGHRDFPNVKKACPCFDAMQDYAWISKRTA